MKLKNVKIQNWGGISDFESPIDNINIVMGKNGAGKSSLFSGLKYGLLGGVTNTKEGTFVSNISLELDDNGDAIAIDRTVHDGKGVAKLNGQTTTNISITEMLGADKKIIRFLTSSQMDDLSSAELAQFLFESGLININIAIDKFINIANCSNAAEMILLDELPQTFSLNEINKVNKTFSDQRKQLEKEVFSLEKVAEMSNDDSLVVPSETLKQLEAAYEAVIKAEAKQAAAVKAKTQLQQLEAEISKVEGQLKNSTALKPNPNEEQTLRSKLNETIDRIAKTAARKEAFEKNNQLCLKQMKNLESSKCPLSDKITCTQDKSALIDEISIVIDTNDIQIGLCNDDMSVLAKDKVMLEDKLANYDKAKKAYENRLLLLGQLKNLQDAKKICESSIGVSNTRDFSQVKLDLQSKIDLRRRFDEAEKAKSQIKRKREDLDVYKELEEITSKKGTVKSKLLSLMLSTLVDPLNERAKIVAPQIKLSLEVDKKGGVAIYCDMPTGKVDFKDISAGERLMVEFLIMSQINELSGFKILIMDNLDKLDKDHFKGLIEFLLTDEAKNLYDTVFLATVNHSDFESILASYPEVNQILL